jgi:putative hemolysin
MHTRFPVSEEAGNPQRILGYVNFKDIISALRLSPHDPSLRNLVRRIRHFDAETSVADCLEHLMREHSHIALVRDRDGTVVGMITLEDIIEELVGEIHDEYDRVPAFLTPAGNGWIAGGFVPLAKLRETTGLDFVPLGEKPIYTLNDWITERLDGPPSGGDVINSDSCRVVIRKTMNMLIQEAFVSGIDATETDGGKQKG